MKFAYLSIAALVAGAAALPTNGSDDYSKDVSKDHGKDYSEDYSKDYSESKDTKIYSDSKEHSDDKDYSDKDGKKDSLNAFPFHFTSTYHALAKPDMIINAQGNYVAGQEGAVGYFNFGINPYQEVICYNITLVGVTGEYQSPAATATHLHQSAEGQFGPPRLAFPNPTGDGNTRTSVGCLQGPFKTGLNATSGELQGQDTATGFSLWEIESNPGGFAADTHTSQFVAGAVRGQLRKKD